MVTRDNKSVAGVLLRTSFYLPTAQIMPCRLFVQAWLIINFLNYHPKLGFEPKIRSLAKDMLGYWGRVKSNKSKSLKVN